MAIIWNRIEYNEDKPTPNLWVSYIWPSAPDVITAEDGATFAGVAYSSEQETDAEARTQPSLPSVELAPRKVPPPLIFWIALTLVPPLTLPLLP